MTHYMELLATNQPWNLIFFMAIPVVLAESLVATEFFVVYRKASTGALRTWNKWLGIVLGFLLPRRLSLPDGDDGAQDRLAGAIRRDRGRRIPVRRDSPLLDRPPGTRRRGPCFGQRGGDDRPGKDGRYAYAAAFCSAHRLPGRGPRGDDLRHVEPGPPDRGQAM